MTTTSLGSSDQFLHCHLSVFVQNKSQKCISVCHAEYSLPSNLPSWSSSSDGDGSSTVYGCIACTTSLPLIFHMSGWRYGDGEDYYCDSSVCSLDFGWLLPDAKDVGDDFDDDFEDYYGCWIFVRFVGIDLRFCQVLGSRDYPWECFSFCDVRRFLPISFCW